MQKPSRERIIPTGFYAPLFLFVIFSITLAIHDDSLIRRVRRVSKRVSCISDTIVSPQKQKKAGKVEGLGAFIKRTQLALFLAETNDVPMTYGKHASSHGYDISSLFGQCEFDTVPDECVLDQKKMILPRCKRGDCACLRKTVEPYTIDAEKKCDVIAIKPDGLLTNEYAGCISNTLRRYLGTGASPRREYDVVHHRQGDLEGKANLKTFSRLELYFIIRTMCKLSTRDIVILTEGTPMIPACEDRIVLANDLSMQETFRIVRYGKNVAVAGSSFAQAMLQVAKPERLFVMSKNVPIYDWVPVKKWTVIGTRGIANHFESREEMLKVVLVYANLPARSFNVGLPKESDYNESVPTRLWKKEEGIE